MNKAFLSAFLALSALWGASAQETKTVYVIEPVSMGNDAREANELWSSRMTLPTEAARLYAPTAFTRKPFTLDLQLSGSFSSRERRVLERSDTNTLVAYELSFTLAAPLPKPAKRITVRFSLADLMKADGPLRQSPGMYAMSKAIHSSGYTRGRAWIETLSYGCDGTFKAVIALRKN